MDPIKTKTAVWVGAIGGVATIVGVALPWLLDNSQDPALSVNGLLTGPYVLLFGVVMAAASVFLLTDTDPLKVVAILGPVSLAVLAYVIPIVLNKEAGLFGGVSSSPTTSRGIGLYVAVLGGILGLVATAIVAKGLMAPDPTSSDAQPAFDLGEVTEQKD
jgi:uncharacterized membrane protein